jgi:hypothetical protein
MGQEYSQIIHGKARELYTVDGLTFEQVAAELAELFPSETPSLTQIKRWAKEEEWRDRRSQLRRGLMELEDGSIDAKKRLLNLCRGKLKSLEESDQEIDSQTMFGLVRVVNVVSPKESAKKFDGVQAPDIDRPALFIEDMQFIANILKEVDPEGLKVMARNFDLIITRFKATHAQAS